MTKQEVLREEIWIVDRPSRRTCDKMRRKELASGARAGDEWGGVSLQVWRRFC